MNLISAQSRVREACNVFRESTPSREVILESLNDLMASLAWAKEHGVREIESNALWGLYLCFSRLDSPSEAADALIELRSNLEQLRHGITDPMERGGVFRTYPHLFKALCEQLFQAGRPEDLLEAIESSKGRIVADTLTREGTGAISDAAIYDSIASLPALTRLHGFHYMSYFVDDEHVYAAIVTKQGEIRVIKPVQISSKTLRRAAASVDPKTWSEGPRPMNVSRALAPLVVCLDEFLKDGVMSKDDHICYSSDEDFLNIPLHFLRFRDGILGDWFSFSRIQNAFHLSQCLDDTTHAPPSKYVGIIVPTAKNIENDTSGQLSLHLHAPLEWLAEHGKTGHSLCFHEATVNGLLHEELDHRIVHFSTHGWFPHDAGNPFHDSFLLLSDEKGLPDWDRIENGRKSGALTPKRILDSDFDLTGSHVSLMACVSGLAREGLAGDTLGLEWAFILKGASSLISTHWEVSAACAADFFILFYERWMNTGMSRAVAHRETMLELLAGNHSRKSLRKWAAFSLSGDFR